MKILYFIMTLMFISLLASCSQEEQVNQETDRVSISAELPGDIAATRAQITVPATHKLRCIIEVWTKSANPTLKYRKEVAVEGGAMPTFDFGLTPGDYTCLMWADFIKKDAPSTEVTVGVDVTYTHFEDTYYNTTDLNQITIKDELAANLFDTDLCDGFYAHLEVKKDETTVQKTVKMARPFAKLIVKENEAEKFASLKSLAVVSSMPKSFNVATGEPGAEMISAVYDKECTPADNSQVLFTGYLFVPSTGLSMQSFTLSFTTATGKTACEIEEGSIMLKRNEQMTASGKLIGEGMITPDPDPDPTPGADPKVGDYFFSNGTWGNELTEANKANCVGIVYAEGVQPGDDISNYPNSDGKSIKGYVMGLKTLYGTANDGLVEGETMGGGRIFWYNMKSDIYSTLYGTFPYVKPLDVDNFNGYAKTEGYLNSDAFKAHSTDFYFPSLQFFKTWRDKQTVVANASQWYIPSFKQLSSVIGGCYGYPAINSYFDFPEVKKVDALNAAFEKAKSELACGDFTTGKHFILSSTISLKQPAYEPIMILYNGASEIKPQQVNRPQSAIRPVLTIIK